MNSKDINELNSVMKIIEKIGKCPSCYFENIEHQIKLMSPTFNVAHIFQCNKCGGIHGTDIVIEAVDMDLRK